MAYAEFFISAPDNTLITTFEQREYDSFAVNYPSQAPYLAAGMNCLAINTFEEDRLMHPVTKEVRYDRASRFAKVLTRLNFPAMHLKVGDYGAVYEPAKPVFAIDVEAGPDVTRLQLLSQGKKGLQPAYIPGFSHEDARAVTSALILHVENSERLKRTVSTLQPQR